MSTTVQKWGNSLGIRIPKIYAKKVNIKQGDLVDIEADSEKLVIKPDRRKRLDLKDLVSKINEENIHNEADFGDRAGREIW